MFIVTNLFLLLQFVSALHGNSEFAGDVAYGLLQTVYALNPNRVSKLKPYFDLGRANGNKIEGKPIHSTVKTTTTTKILPMTIKPTETTNLSSLTSTPKLNSTTKTSKITVLPTTTKAPKIHHNKHYQNSTKTRRPHEHRKTKDHQKHTVINNTVPKSTVTNHTIPAVTKHNLTLPKLNSVAAKVKNKIRVEEMTTLTTKKIDIRTKIPTTTSPSEDLDEHVTISEATTRRTTKDMLNCEGEWSDWSNMGKCSEECGSCGVIQRFRTCLSYKNGTGCPCSGQYKTIRACNVKPCKFPKPSCCPPYDLMYKHEQFWCGPQDEDIIEDALKDSA